MMIHGCRSGMDPPPLESVPSSPNGNEAVGPAAADVSPWLQRCDLGAVATGNSLWVVSSLDQLNSLNSLQLASPESHKSHLAGGLLKLCLFSIVKPCKPIGDLHAPSQVSTGSCRVAGQRDGSLRWRKDVESL